MDQVSETLRDTLESLYREIEATRMDGVPILNRKLEVAALGFEPYQDYFIGVLLTPWFMNLMLVPQDQMAFAEISPQVGAKRMENLPAGKVEFIIGYEVGFGWSMSCSLFSPVFEFEDHTAALEAARAALSEILNSEAETDDGDPDMHDIRAGKLPVPAAKETGEERQPPSGPPADVTRRDFFRGGRVPENPQTDAGDTG